MVMAREMVSSDVAWGVAWEEEPCEVIAASGRREVYGWRQYITGQYLHTQTPRRGAIRRPRRGGF